MSYLVICKNCGKQTMIDGGDPDERCLLCGKPALRKEQNMEDKAKDKTKIVSEAKGRVAKVDKEVDSGIPPRPKKRKQWPQYFEDNKEAIIQDYQVLRLKQFFTKWHISTNLWIELKERWNVAGKSRGNPLSKLKSRGKNRTDPTMFPPFNEVWSDEVKMRWLDDFVRLRELETK